MRGHHAGRSGRILAAGGGRGAGIRRQPKWPTPSASTSSFRTKGSAPASSCASRFFPGTNPDLANPPLLSRCLDPGGAAVSFEGLRSGDYSVLLPGPGSDLTEPRYQGQLVATNIPEDERLASFGIDVNVGLAPEFAGTTGRVQVSVFGCPAGTDNGANKEGWAAECQALAGGVPLTLSGTGSINDAAFQAVTGLSGRRIRAGSSSPTCHPAPTSSAASYRKTSPTPRPSSSSRASTAALARSSRATPSPCARPRPSPSTSTWSSTRTTQRPVR